MAFHKNCSFLEGGIFWLYSFAWCSVIIFLPAGSQNKEFNFRHDWNSLISDDESLQMRYYSRKYFPPADDYVSLKTSTCDGDSFPSLWLNTCFAYSHFSALYLLYKMPLDLQRYAHLIPIDSRQTYAFCTNVFLLLFWWLWTSLVPRPSHCPVFDCFQYAKTEGEGLVYFITWMTSVSTWVDRGGEVGRPGNKASYELHDGK